MDYIIRTNKLCKKYKETTALNHVSLNIPQDAVYGLIGNNDAGKTTLMRILANLQVPTSGSVRKMRGIRVGAVIETPAIYPLLSAHGNLKYQMSITGAKGKSIKELLEPEYKLDVESNEMTENPLYLSGFKRTAANVHLLISPFAQAEYEEFMLYETPEEKQNNSLVLKDFPYHIEFCAVNILELMLFCKIGIRIFNKQDLR